MNSTYEKAADNLEAKTEARKQMQMKIESKQPTTK